MRTLLLRSTADILTALEHTGAPLEEVELQMLGTTHSELLKVILKCIGLPEPIRGPIERYQRLARINSSQPLVLRALMMADNYANGLLLASSTASTVSPFLVKDWNGLSGAAPMVVPDGAEIRSQVYCLTAVLSRMSASDQATLLKPPFPKSKNKLWLAREPMFASADPFALALNELTEEVAVYNHLPSPEQMAGFSGLAIEADAKETPGWSQADIDKCQSEAAQGCFMWLGSDIRIDGPALSISIEQIQRAIAAAPAIPQARVA
jgi:hypothetical protein